MPNHRRLPKSAYQPLRIRAYLQCGIVGDIHCPLDAVLYYIVHREQYGRQDITHSGGSGRLYSQTQDTSLPLARHEEHGPQWYYAASFAQWPEHYAEGSDAWSKRLATGRVGFLDAEKKGSVDIAAGRYKAYRMPMFYRHALYVDWYAMGEPELLKRLLSFATHLGKKTDQGWGHVLRWEVEPWRTDWSVRGESGELMRAIPAKEGMLYGYRPSYWAPQNQALCEMPFALQQSKARA